VTTMDQPQGHNITFSIDNIVAGLVGLVTAFFTLWVPRRFRAISTEKRMEAARDSEYLKTWQAEVEKLRGQIDEAHKQLQLELATARKDAMDWRIRAVSAEAKLTLLEARVASLELENEELRTRMDHLENGKGREE